MRGHVIKTRTANLPGQNGTEQLVSEYGDQLVCVRYGYDKQKQKRYKTVELIVNEQDWIPGTSISPDKRVMLRIGYGETELREKMKETGGFWNAEQKAWTLSYHKSLRLGLEQRIIDPEFDL